MPESNDSPTRKAFERLYPSSVMQNDRLRWNIFKEGWKAHIEWEGYPGQAPGKRLVDMTVGEFIDYVKSMTP